MGKMVGGSLSRLQGKLYAEPRQRQGKMRRHNGSSVSELDDLEDIEVYSLSQV